ncbi:CLUMA_CG002046, isoform A [Clunio marinus]|uniref:CLUMA_CG002046, isoform A n=1 Tax=Clunio marinus TaxID=568069 RepID=A0A1J1HL53_9DIPT|nr:CLUMA_CG002046, isoform A [Clunio marinus]
MEGSSLIPAPLHFIFDEAVKMFATFCSSRKEKEEKKIVERKWKKHFQAIEIIFDVIIISICYTNARCNQNNILHVAFLLSFSGWLGRHEMS